MRALVTGASGFVGGHLVDECLRRGDRVRVLVRPSSDLSHLRGLGVEMAFGELSEAGSLARAARDSDVIYHSAALVSDIGTRQRFHAINVDGTRRLLDAAKGAGVSRFVFVSSPSVVMDSTDQLDIDERQPYPARFLNHYCETKARAEQLVLAANGPELVTCAIRPRGVWGPRDRAGFLPKIVAKLLSQRMPDLSGGKKVMASLCHVDNAVHACALAARAPGVGGKAYFITDPEPIDVWQFANTVIQLFSLPPMRRKINPALLAPLAAVVEAVWKLRPLERRYSPPLSRYALALLTLSGTYDIRAARRDLGYEPIVDGKRGLAQLKSWVDSIGGVREFVRYVT